jgi:RND family efflux transporter MFP subunit
VIAARQSALSAEVAGRIIYMSPALVAGGQFEKGEVLLRNDPVDYKLAVTLAQAQILEAETKLKLAQQEAAAAREDWRRIRGSKAGTPPALVAKEPQLAAARANLAAAQARLSQAELDLKRTEVIAPFDGRVTTKAVDLGQYLRKGDKVADVYSIDAAEIVVSLENQDLAWLSVPGLTPEGDPGSKALVTTRFAGQEISWKGQVVRSEGELDRRTRLVPVVVRVNKPYSRRPPLTVGLFVTVEMIGSVVPKACLLPRAVMHENDVVWVYDREQEALKFRKVKVARRWGDKVLITGGLKQGELVVTSSLRSVSDGMKVRLASAERPEAS